MMDIKESFKSYIAKDNSDKNKSESSSIYSTPLSSIEKLTTLKDVSSQEKLVEETKARMTEKFNQLEQETGLNLRPIQLDDTINSKNGPTSVQDSTCSSLSDEGVKLTPSEVKEQAALRLEQELRKTQQDLKLKDDQIAKLSRIRTEVETELEDLTASLFEEANKLVRNANIQKARSEKGYQEAKMKIDVLQAEVQALKMLVLNSTPSSPGWRSKTESRNGMKGLISRSDSCQNTPKKSPSNYEFGANHDHFFESNGINCDLNCKSNFDYNTSSIDEVDPVFHEQFLEWKRNPSLEKDNTFIISIYEVEIYPTLNFKNVPLTQTLLMAIEDNSITIESVSDKTSFPKKCALLDIPRMCKYRMKLGEDWYNISTLCRNRIIAVCDLFCYLRYIKQGLVKSSFHEVYWQVMQRRKNIALARLGFHCS